MSLSADTKDALAREVPSEAHCRQALLAGLAIYGCPPGAARFVTQRNAVARLFRLLGGQQDHIRPIAGRRLRHAPSYGIDLVRAMAPPPKPAHRCDRTMEARAAFLACGSLSAGSRGYHLEFVAPGEAAAERLAWMLRAVGSAPKAMQRKGRTVLYLKDFERIVEFLTVVGAHGAVLHLEDVHALKETKNRIHRLVNTEAANLERAAAAGAGHRETIEFLASAYGLQYLSASLREIARLRMEHPDETLLELGRRCSPPVGKPTVNSRLMALGRLARRLRGESSASSA